MKAHTGAAPQLTARAIILAIALAMILAAANVYLGLFAGATIASAIPAAVVSMAVLRALGAWQDFQFWWVLAIAGLGGLLGVLFSVPLRRSLVVEQQMSFPEGQAAAEVLKAGTNPAQGAKILAVSALAGGA